MSARSEDIVRHGTISIAMCTFNGAAWVEQQLRSIAAQERSPDELIICDDASADSTCDILNTFAKSAQFPVKITRNDSRMGVASNFSQAIEKCSGDLIALADQDDWWGPCKLETLARRLTEDPNLGLAFSDANLVDESLRPLNARLWDTLYLDPLQRQRLTNGQAIPVLARTNVVTGATMMFRGRLKPHILPISPHWIHDGWIALISSAIAPCAMVDEPLIDYRQHGRQQIGARRTTLLEQVRLGLEMDTDYFRREMLRWGDAYQRFRKIASILRYPRDLQILSEKADFSRHRYQMRLEPAERWGAIGEHWRRGHYETLGWGWKSLLQDIVIVP